MTPDELRAAADRATELLDAQRAGKQYGTFRLAAAAPDLLAVLAPAARQLADTQDEVQRLRGLCGFLIDACATHRIPVPLNSSLLDLAADIASDGGAAVGSVDPEGEA